MPDKVSLSKINQLAIPAIFAGIVEPLIGLVDTLFIGRSPISPVESLAAIGLGTSFYLFVFWVFVQLETALSSIVAKYVGEKKEKKLNTLITQALLLNFTIGIGLYIITNLFIEEIMSLYHAKNLVLELSIKYFNIRSIGFPIALTTYTIWGVFRGLQNTWWAMLIGFIGGSINIVLSYLLIFGTNSIQALGVEGAAIGSVIAQGVMLVISLLIFQLKTPFKIVFQKKIHPELKNLITISWAFIIRTIMLNIVLIQGNAFATKLGDVQIAAHTIAMQIWLFTSFLLDGYANAGLALSARLLGEKRPRALKNLIKTLLKIGVIISLITVVFLSYYYTSWGIWFSSNTEVVSTFESILIFIILSQPINAIAFTYDGILKGIAAANFIRNMMIVATIIFIGALYVIEHFYHFGLKSVWMALIVWMIFRSILPYLYLAKRYRSS